MKKLVDFSKKIAHISRANDWKGSFVPFVMGFVYLWLFMFQLKPTKQTGYLCLFSLLTTIGFASFGYLINEFFDQDEDKKAGKLNRFETIGVGLSSILFITSILLTFLPWIYLPSNKWSWVLICFEIGSFLLYSIPPFRLKRFPLISCVFDASYAYLIPIVLSMYTFSIYAEKSLFKSHLIWLAIPAFFIGFRNIILHQIKDVIGDFHAQRKTLPMLFGKHELFNLLSISLFFEVFSFFVLFESLFPDFHLGGMYIVYFSIKSIFFFKSEELKTSKNEFGFFGLADRFYQIWLPTILLTSLTVKDASWSFLWSLQLFLLVLNFNTHIVNGKFLVVLKMIKEMIKMGASFFVNYSIYYLFLLFGVNLKKREISAWQYISRKK